MFALIALGRQEPGTRPACSTTLIGPIIGVTYDRTMYNCINFQLRSYSTCTNSSSTYLLTYKNCALL